MWWAGSRGGTQTSELWWKCLAGSHALSTGRSPDLDGFVPLRPSYCGEGCGEISLAVVRNNHGSPAVDSCVVRAWGPPPDPEGDLASSQQGNWKLHPIAAHTGALPTSGSDGTGFLANALSPAWSDPAQGPATTHPDSWPRSSIWSNVPKFRWDLVGNNLTQNCWQVIFLLQNGKISSKTFLADLFNSFFVSKDYPD